jgi:hypothetical protein
MEERQDVDAQDRIDAQPYRIKIHVDIQGIARHIPTFLHPSGVSSGIKSSSVRPPSRRDIRQAEHESAKGRENNKTGLTSSASATWPTGSIFACSANTASRRASGIPSHTCGPRARVQRLRTQYRGTHLCPDEAKTDNADADGRELDSGPLGEALGGAHDGRDERHALRRLAHHSDDGERDGGGGVLRHAARCVLAGVEGLERAHAERVCAYEEKWT